MKERRQLQEFIDDAKAITGFTGAGVSTESGIADYRSQGGIWQKFTPVTLDEFTSDPGKRKLYWQRKLQMWPSFRDAQPGPAHIFFTALDNSGKLRGMITQNIDGLHEKSGLPGDKIVNLHGSSLEIRCLDCGDSFAAHGFMDTLDLDETLPVCSRCEGLLKPDTISFGQNLRHDDLLRARHLATDCDLLIAAGSTLVVHPAASFPLLAKQHGARLVIITLSTTPLDAFADLVIHRPLGTLLSEITL